MAKTNTTKKAKLPKTPIEKKLDKNTKTKTKSKKQLTRKPDSDSESEADKLPGLLEAYTRDQLVSLIVDAAVNNPTLYEHIREVVDRDVTHRKIFVHGLAWDATRQTLVLAFEQFGEIEDCNVVTDRATGKAKGYGFVLFKTRKGASKALKEPQKRIGNRMASCQLASLGPAAKEPNSGAAAAPKKNLGTADAKVKNQGHVMRGQLPGQQGQVQPLQPQVMAALAAAQNLNLFSQHPGLNPMYSGLLTSPNPSGFISPAAAGALSHSPLGLGHSFGQGMPATSQLSGGSLLGPYGIYGNSVVSASPQAQPSASQIGQQLVSSRNKGAAGGSFSGHTSYLCNMCSDIEISCVLLNVLLVNECAPAHANHL
ncbi:hypothetical protein CRG98_003261 [Punica granatum]|uniref:RRM domain-containing protein n=1 Tax=Punica granatum TaxID=22663 RepID=A0A2I0L6K7_PUNGR|nr:hypothetical protein CRG98_003261 [Punica granatum]